MQAEVSPAASLGRPLSIFWHDADGTASVMAGRPHPAQLDGSLTYPISEAPVDEDREQVVN